MAGCLSESGKGPNRPALSSPPRLKPFAARLFLLGLHDRKGADAARRPHELLQAPDDGSHPAK